MTTVVAATALDLHSLVPLPKLTDMNTGLSAAKQSTMKKLLGLPGPLTRDCSPIQNKVLLSRMKSHQFNNFKVTGLDVAIDSLVKVMTAIYEHDKMLHSVLRTAGMLCNRAVRGSTGSYSNHSWGTAIDLKVETQLDEMGANKVQKGILEAYPYFHAEGWFWAAGYRTRPDPMHFELADETLWRLFGQNK